MYAAILLSGLVTVSLLNSKRLLITRDFYSVSQSSSSSSSMDGESAITGRGYVLTLAYQGQQGAGTRAIVSQQCWIGSVLKEQYSNLQVYLLEPSLNSTEFVSGTFVNTSTALPFRDLYDIERFNQASARLGLGEMVSIEEFLENAPKRITVLKFTGRGTTKVFWTAQNDSDCYKKNSNGKMSYLLKKGFCITQIITTASTSMGNYFRDKEYIFQDNSDRVLFERWNPLKSVLVTNVWKAGWFVPIGTVPTNTPLSEHPSDSSRCKFSDLENVREHLVPSPSLLRDATLYKRAFLLKATSGKSVKTVAVMFRLEHLISGDTVCQSNSSDSIDNVCIGRCLQKAVDIIKSLQKQDGFSSNTFLTHDIGQYGSASILKKHGRKAETSLHELMNTTMLQLFGQAWTLADLDKSYSEISKYEGYIAALQRNIASDADCLVLVGGGTFQDLTLHDYIRKHARVEGRCVHFVCAKREDILRNVSNLEMGGGEGL